ncbi:hypothetical protein PHYPSEUDO_006394 [Phytophthora pseudosyringae]|uniref:Centrosomin N-terminal motif 1 domain-containing protein n=1 Tax=Phytophthora pseudosyringae TaxID=221518 RepID=A0A8T1WFF1_9STRA|nr:hypothetical protein PHYPSEUDO_006394 [Phytophthora pseudosyringae]
MPSSSSSSNSSTPPRPRGRLLRQETAAYEQLRREKFNMGLRIHHLEEKLQLLKIGEGYTEEKVLTELAELRVALKAREHELRQHTLNEIQVVDELKAQLEAARTSTSGEERAHADLPDPISTGHCREMCSRLQAKLYKMTQQEHRAVEDANDLRRQIQKMSRDLEQLGKATRGLKSDHEKALDTIYAFESQELQQREDARRQTNEAEGQAKDAANNQADAIERLQFDNAKLLQALEEKKEEVNTLRADLETAHEIIVDLDNAGLQLTQQHEVAVQKLKRALADAKDEAQALNRTWSRRFNTYRMKKEHEMQDVEKGLQNCRPDGTEAANVVSWTDIQAPLNKRNRILHEELQECYRQYQLVFQENTDMLKATSLYKHAIADRDADIAKYKALVMKYAKQLQRRSSLGQVEDALMKQLQQTKIMIAVTTERLESCPIGGGARGPYHRLPTSTYRRLYAMHVNRITSHNMQLEELEKEIKK